MTPSPDRRERQNRWRTAAPLLLFSILLLIPAPFAVSAQGGGTGRGAGQGDQVSTIYLPTEHPAYRTLERFRAAGLLANVRLDRRPLARRTVAEALMEGVEGAREQGLDGLADAGLWRLREFADEIGSYPGIEQPRRGPVRVYWQGDKADMTAEMTFELAYDTREDLPPDYKGASSVFGGFEVYGTAGRGIGYAGRFRQGMESRRGSIRTAPYAPEQTITSPRSFDENRAYSGSNGHISWDSGIFGFDLRLDSPAWGPSPERNLMLSGHAPNFGHLQGRLEFGDWLRYTLLVGQLRSGIIDSARSYRPEDPTFFRDLERQKYFVGHRIELQPLPRLQVGLQEMLVAADRFPEFNYLVPTVSLAEVQHYLNDPDNTMIGVDVGWMPARGPRLYGAIAVDEWRPEDTFDEERSRNLMAFQMGASWTPHIHGGRWHLWLEATRINPHTYWHKYPVNNWTYDESWLGFWSGQNSEVVEGRLSFLPSPRIDLSLWGRYARKGREWSRTEQYETPPSEKFMEGRQSLGAWVGGRLIYEGEQHWLALVELVRAPARLWPHDRSGGGSVPPASLGQEWQLFIRLVYNPF